MLAVFGAAVNYQSLYPIIIPFCILFVCLSLAIVISIKKQNVKVAMALTFISIVLIAVKNIYIAPMYYYDKGDMSIPQNANFIKDTQNFFYTTSSLDTLSLTKYNNKVLYIELWYSYCLPCIKKLPLIKKINEKYRDREDFVVIGIIDGKLDDIKSFKKMNIEYKDVFDVSLLANKELITKLHQKLGVSVYPIELIIDKSGKIISIHLGYQEPLTDYYYKKTTNTINALLNEK
ncbi:TlpA family protein disulfide reductase [Pedobacter hiemivivus]|nr:TlpA disulfide reductase family protein [Pedobacter hiemivivus]